MGARLDPIIRAAALSGARWQLRRGSANAVVAAVSPVPAAPSAPVPPAAERTPPSEPVATAIAPGPAAANPARLQLEIEQLQVRRQALELEHVAALKQLEERQRELDSERFRLAEQAAEVLANAELRGFQQGQEQGERDAAEAGSAQIGRLASLVNAAGKARRQLLEENEDMLVEIAFAAICRMLGHSASTRSGLAAMVREQLQAGDLTQLVVRVHPQDVPLLTQPVEDGIDEHAPPLQVKGDPSIELGGCMIDGPHGTLDARLELHLQQLRAVLLQVRSERSRNEVAL